MTLFDDMFNGYIAFWVGSFLSEVTTVQSLMLIISGGKCISVFGYVTSIDHIIKETSHLVSENLTVPGLVLINLAKFLVLSLDIT